MLMSPKHAPCIHGKSHAKATAPHACNDKNGLMVSRAKCCQRGPTARLMSCQVRFCRAKAHRAVLGGQSNGLTRPSFPKGASTQDPAMGKQVAKSLLGCLLSPM